MRVFAVFLFVLVVALVVVLAKAFFYFNTTPPQPQAPLERIRPVAANPVEQGKSEEDARNEKSSVDAQPHKGPLCDAAPEPDKSPIITLPPGLVLKPGTHTSKPSWTYVNIWASWCKPCKEEMPVIAEWAKDISARAKGIRLVFLSVDDDERQLERYMEVHGKTIEGEFRWVKDEASRIRFYQSLKLSDSPTLPIQVVLDEKARLRCLRVGSVAREDLDEFARTYGL